MSNIVIVGGTGMLAPATREIARYVQCLTLVARDPGSLADEIGARVLRMDWTKDEDVSKAISSLSSMPPVTLLISWVHERGMACLPRFESVLMEGGRSIRVHGSSVGDPSNGVQTDPSPPSGVLRQDVVLGWIAKENGARRWLTDDEISAGVLTAFHEPQTRSLVVGQVS